MEECGAWIVGILLGIVYPPPVWSRARAIPFVALVAVLGIGITVFSGEWFQHPGFALVDIGQVALAAALGVVARRHILDRYAPALIIRKAR